MCIVRFIVMPMPCVSCVCCGVLLFMMFILNSFFFIISNFKR